jgi:hypothetical protein
MPAASETITRAKAKASAVAAAAAAAATVPETIPESQVFDEFVAHSDSDEEREMHEVEADLQDSVISRGASLVTYRIRLLAGVDTTAPSFYSETESQTHGPSAKGLRTSRRLQHSSPNVAALADPDDSDEDEEDELEDDSDAELLERVRKLEGHAPPPPPPPTASRKESKGGDDDDNEPESSSSEEVFPSPGTRAGAEKRRRTMAAKVAPYEPPRGTRAASIVEKERARNAVARRR